MHGEFKSVNATNANDHVLAAETIGELIDIETRIVIDASGRRTAAARQLGSSRQVLTNLVASWATLPLGAITAAPGLLAIEAIDREWWYVAVGRRSIAAAVLGRRPPRRSDTWITAARGTDILRSLDASVIVFPAAQAANVSITEPLCGDNWFAAGDAAASFDPLSGYGLSFAIGTGHAAACAADARLRDERIAPLSYAALITDRIARTMAGMDEAYRALAAARTGSP
jgi:flavin-dependent dehydrogenase